MRFLSHRNSVIKIKYNVWLDSAKWTSAGACVHFTEMPDKKHDLKQCASSKSEEVGGAGYRKEVGVEVCVCVRERWRERGGWEERERKTTLLANECSEDDVIGNSWRRGKKNNSELG